MKNPSPYYSIAIPTIVFFLSCKQMLAVCVIIGLLLASVQVYYSGLWKYSDDELACLDVVGNSDRYFTSHVMGHIVQLVLWLCITSMNAAVIVGVWGCCKKKQERVSLQQNNAVQHARAKRERRVTVLMVVISATYTFLATPDVAIVISMYSYPDLRLYMAQYSETLNKLNTFIEIVSASVTFVFYTLTGSHFRQQMAVFFRYVFKCHERGRQP